MKYIISESRLQYIFDRYMESEHDLRYFPNTRSFIGREMGGNGFGQLFANRFFYEKNSEMELLQGMFGKDTNKLLLNYLRNKFPDVKIKGIETDDVDSLFP